jgi:hypothetical protein
MGILRDYLSGRKGDWHELWLFGTVIASLLAGFLQPPPALSYGSDDRLLTRFAQFSVTIFAGLLVAIGMKYRKKRYWLRWLLVCAVSIVLATTLFVTYGHVTQEFTGPYNYERVVIGSIDSLKNPERDRKAVEQNVGKLIMDHYGNVYEIWKDRSINNRRTLLQVLFILTLPCFTASMLALLQAIYCIKAKG